MSWIVCFVLVLLSISLIARLDFFHFERISRINLFLAYLVKILASLAFIWLYTYYYTDRSEADVYKYFDDGLILYEVSKTSVPDFLSLVTGFGGNVEELTQKYLLDTRFWDRSPALPILNDNRLIIRFNALMNLISGGNIYVHVMVAIFISFLGLTMMLKFFLRYFQDKSLIVFWILFFTPSLLFWSSSVLKESFLIFGLGGFLMNLSDTSKSILLRVLSMLIFALIILLSKVYILAILIPLSISFIWEEGRTDGKTFLRYTSVFLFFTTLALCLKWLIGYDILSALAFKQSEFKCLAEWIGAGSVVYIPDLNGTFTSIIYAGPFALYNALFRPLPWDVNSAISAIAMMETVSLILLMLCAMIFRKKVSKNNRNIFLFSLFFLLSLALLIGLTTPVLGAIVRYRIILLPFFILLLFMITDVKKLSKFVGQKKTP